MRKIRVRRAGSTALAVLSFVAAVLAVLYGVFTVAKEWDFPSASFWTAQGAAGPALPLIFVLGGVAVVWVAIETQLLRVRLRRDNRLEALEEYLQSLVLNFYEADATKLPYNKLAAHIWRVRRRWFLGREVLQRVVTYKPDGKVPASGVEWCEGKGVVGMAWGEMMPYTVNLADLQDAYSRGTFDTLPEAKRLGLSAGEFKRVKHYWAVYVAPLRDKDNGDLRGVATVAVIQDGSFAALARAARAAAVDEPVTAIEALVREM